MSKAAPFVYVIVGATGTGKSSQIRVATEAERRALWFDPMREFGDCGAVRDLAGVKESLIASRGGPCAIVYQPGVVSRRAEFNKLCELAFKAEDLCFVVDEAHEVTGPWRHLVEPWWNTLMREGRHRAMRTVLATHRPADLDKALWNFVTRLRTGRLNYKADVRELAGALNVDHAEVAALIGRQWIERDMLTGEVTRGAMEWRSRRPVNVPRALAPTEKKSAGRRAVQ